MKYNFVINTTVARPLNLDVDSNITTHDFMGSLLQTIEDKTILYKNEVLDIFVQDTLNNDTMSIPSDNQSVETLIQMNRDYFPISPITKNTYQIYVIDRMYRERLVIDEDNIKQRKKKQIKTSHFGDFFGLMRKKLSFL